SAAACSRTMVSKTMSKSRTMLACRRWSCSPSLRAAARRFLDWDSEPAKVGFKSPATVVAVGTNLCNISSCFCSSSTPKLVQPVTLPPGRLMLATSPSATGSAAVEKTIGIVVVDAFAATTDEVPAAAITATGTRTSSAANAGNRSMWSSAQRYSIVTFRPSTKPSLLRPWRNAAAMGAYPLDVWPLRTPTTGIAACCARAARATCGSETVAPAPPRSVMNSRRLMSNMGPPPYRVGATKNHRGRRPLSLPPAGLQVLGLDLKIVLDRSGPPPPPLLATIAPALPGGEMTALRDLDLAEVGFGS